MAPSPATTKVSPVPTPVRRIARTQQPSGSVNEATASDIPSGTRKVTWRTFSAGTRTYSAKPPGSRFDALKARHIETLPRRQ
jgi:hypothetical protein